MAIWSLGYWSPLDVGILPVVSINMGALTHIGVFAALANPNGTVDLTTEDITTYAASLISAAHAAGVKVLLTLLSSSSVTFGGHAPTDLLNAMTNHRAAFVGNLLSAVSTYGFDGVDVNWENYSGHETLLTNLISDLRTGLGAGLLQATTPVNPSSSDWTYWGGTNATYLDKVAIETYDLIDSAYTWHTSPLYNNADPEWSVELARTRYVTTGGVPAAKFMIGIAFQGWQYSGGSPNPVDGPRITTGSPPTLTQYNYRDFAAQIGVNGTYGYDAAAQAPYLSGNSTANSWLSYDDATGIAAKINYVKANSLGGWIIFNLASDRVSGTNPLTTAVQNAFVGGAKLVRGAGSLTGLGGVGAMAVNPSLEGL